MRGHVCRSRPESTSADHVCWSHAGQQAVTTAEHLTFTKQSFSQRRQEIAKQPRAHDWSRQQIEQQASWDEAWEAGQAFANGASIGFATQAAQHAWAAGNKPGQSQKKASLRP